jgi:hypothetical protein
VQVGGRTALETGQQLGEAGTPARSTGRSGRVSRVERMSQARGQTADALAVLAADGWLVLPGLQRPGRRFSSIDHIAVGPGGVVVVDTRDWTGAVDVVGGLLRLDGRPLTRECDTAVSAASAVTAWLEPAHRTAVMPLIALVNQPTPDHQPRVAATYAVGDLADVLRALPPRFRTGEIWEIADHLRRTLADGDPRAQLTTASLAATAADLAGAGGVPRQRGGEGTSTGTRVPRGLLGWLRRRH